MGQGDTGFISAGGGSITVQGDPTVVPVGNSLLIPGAAMSAHVDPTTKALALDAVLSEPAESYCFTVGGTPPSPTALSLWRNTTRSQAIFVRKMQAYFRTAQTTADVANYYRLKAVGSVSGSALLPLTAVANSFLLNNGYGAVIDQGISPTSSGGLIASFPSGTQQIGCAWAFTVSQVQTLTGLSSRGISVTAFGGGGSYTIPGTMRVRASILDANGNTLASAKSQYIPGNGTSCGYVGWAFPSSLIVSPGNTYYMAFDNWQDYPILTGTDKDTQLVSFNFWVPSTVVNGTDSGAALNFGNDTTGRCVYPGGSAWAGPPSVGALDAAGKAAAFHAFTWKQQFANVPPPNSAWGMTNNATTPNNMRQMGWFANGSPSGLATVNGDVTFSIDTVGTPPGTGLGAELTVEALLSVL